MNIEVLAIIVFVAAAVLWLLLRKLAHKSSIIRWFWNTSFKIAAHIPLCGWMACFMVAVTDEEKAMKDGYRGIGRKADELGVQAVAAAGERQHRENEMQRQRMQQEQAEREAREKELRGLAYQKLGRSDAHLNSDGSMVRLGDGDYVPVAEFERKLRER